VRAQATLRERERRFRQLLDALPAAIYTTDAVGGITYYNDAAAELWDRYNRGERSVFTRQLYTTQGQQTFDEIRKRYRADRDFQETVDRYIDEFEQLLEEVSRNDRGRVVASTYLISETGKVYTMLAHAAGRLE